MLSSENNGTKLNSCQCRNSIKLKILEKVNDCSKPWNLRNLIEKIFCCVKKDNQHLVIDDDFLKTYIRSIVSEMVDSKLISLIDIKQEGDYVFVKLDSVKLEINMSKLDLSRSEKRDKESSENCIEDSYVSNKSDKNKNQDAEKDLLVEKVKKIDKLLSLRKNLDKLKKENKNKKLHNEIHKYNEIKDIGQELLGRIATSERRKIKDLYEDLDISDDENK
jgi:hypothetical protein